jgi:ATP-dependent Clp protease ATP-binding subunit ClpC
MRNRRFPDKAIDVLDQCVAYALTLGKKTVGLAEAESVASRLVGRPVAGSGPQEPLRERILRAVPLQTADAEFVANRVEVTARGLDLRPHRPNLVALLVSEAVPYAEPLAELLAEALAGSAERVVSIDCSRFVHREDVTMLVGAPPGYVGYGDLLPLHRVLQTPWCAVLFHAVDSCHPQIREVVAQALSNGYFLDGQGRRIWLSDATVLMTASARAGDAEPLGFSRAEATDVGEVREIVEDAVGAGLLAQVDLIVSRVARSQDARRSWIEGQLLRDLSERWSAQGVRIEWDPSVVTWILDQPETGRDRRAWERVVEDRLGPVLLRSLGAAAGKAVRLRVSARDGSVHVEADPNTA